MTADRGPDVTGPGPDIAEPVETDRISGGMPRRPDDERYEERVRRERSLIIGPGYDPADVPPAADADLEVDLTATDQYQNELAELRRQRDAGELITEGQAPAFPPTSYERT